MRKLLPLFLIALSTSVFAQNKQKPDFSSFLAKGYVVIEQIQGDLNNDGSKDYVLVVKGTDKSKLVKDEDGETVDRNNRGMVVLFNNNGKYELAVKNYTCFSSDNEDGGGYYAPELSIEVNKGKLFVNYAHGRYGYNSHTFRYKNSDFDLIGYDESNSNGPIVTSEVSINFLTKKKLTKENVSKDPEIEKFKETWSTVKIERVIKLSEINRFEDLDFSS